MKTHELHAVLCAEAHVAPLKRLEEYLVAEFPLEISEGDILTDRAIDIMKKLKRQIGMHAVADQIFSGKRL